MVNSLGERGQLILVGALTVAVSIVALTVFLNTTLFTESIAPSTASDQLDDAREFDRQARAETLELLHRINLQDRNRTFAQLTENATRGVGNYSQLLTASYAQSGSATVNVSFDPGASGYGNRTVQMGDANLTAPGGNENWEPLDDSDLTSPRQTVGWFVLDVNVEKSNTSFTNITASNSTESIKFSVRKNSSGTGTNVTIISNPSFGPAERVTCDPSFGRALIDLYRGAVSGDTCANGTSFTGIQALSPPHALEIKHGDYVTAEYEYVVNESGSASPSLPDCDTGEPATDPCSAPAVWQANLSTAYFGTAATYQNS